ncbi:hypothetical protein HanRHA438_Chr13g0610851 [Helianthus annuus]|uniref:Uncharacterized protein n=1 Tax=Helianthus annuus TaxID=4232 RepID=A0A251STR6_HELAN|nr:hypothetical protein HanXRQr2_Chr13g0600221 [Helianthus annuus]KAJ0477777.1 hypothetical protein HanHA300_Chr13g0492461 [Helianthus annuus]KAJ0482353.1 hypothetical protein HanIR_Chr13g0652951 [Helianthus annuus]KAJ0498609.1 hypothetical protein HanHA89_Chr13g0524581 [Helianthus annuus]KAJ0664623.1 hypothetical protein HanLR1_Chr13g0494581 [Helianthus annuus]
MVSNDGRSEQMDGRRRSKQRNTMTIRKAICLQTPKILNERGRRDRGGCHVARRTMRKTMAFAANEFI